MAQLAASDVTYTLVEGSRISNPANPMTSALFNITFGDGTATYTSGGIPLTKAKLGCPENLSEFYILNPSNGDGYLYKYNHTANTVQIYQAPAQSHVHQLIMAGGVTTTADFLYHSSGAFGKAAATNVTIAGTSPTTQGGVVSATLAAAGLAEIATSAAIAATTLRVRAVGW